MAWDAGTITSAAPWAAVSQKLKDLITGGSGVANWSFVENVPAGTGIGQSGSATYSLDVFRCRGATTLYKRATHRNLASATDTSNVSTYNFTPTLVGQANRFFICAVISTKASSADDPSTVSFSNGANNPTFTKIKSQAGGAASSPLKVTLWIGKTGGSAPTGTTLNVDFGGASQTSCAVTLEEFDGMDFTLGATTVDPTGAAQIGIQVVGANGTTQTAHTATLAAYLGAQSLGYVVAAETASGGTYSVVEEGWVATATGLTGSSPTVNSRAAWRNDPDDTTPLLTLSSATSETDWACIAFEFQRTTEATSITNANDAGKDWYFTIAIPVTDGAVNSSMYCAEDYDGNKLFRGMPPTIFSGTPTAINNRRSNTLTQYTAVPSSNHGNLTWQILNTTGFNYWIKLTPNAVILSSRVGGVEATLGAMLLDTFVTNTSDLPLIMIQHVAAGNTCSRLPGVIVSVTSGWSTSNYPWTVATNDPYTLQTPAAQDLWASLKVHLSRIFCAHTPGRSSIACYTVGYARGLWKDTFLCGLSGTGTVQLGDIMVVNAQNWTVIAKGTFGGAGSLAMFILTRAT